MNKEGTEGVSKRLACELAVLVSVWLSIARQRL